MISWLEHAGAVDLFVTASIQVSGSTSFSNFASTTASGETRRSVTNSSGTGSSATYSSATTYSAKPASSFSSSTSIFTPYGAGYPIDLETTASLSEKLNEWGDPETIVTTTYATIETQSTRTCHTIGTATASPSGTITQFTTSTQTVTTLTVSSGTEVTTEIGFTTFSSIASSAWNPPKFNTIIQAQPGEVLYVVEASQLSFWTGNDAPFLSEIAQTSTRITLPYTPYLTTITASYISALPAPITSNLGESTITDSYRALVFEDSSFTTTITLFSGAVPTPTTTALPYRRLTTTSSTFAVATTLSASEAANTIYFEKMGKIECLTKDVNRAYTRPRDGGGYPLFIPAGIDDSPILTYDQIVATEYASASFAGFNNDYFNPALIVTGPTPTGNNYGRTHEGNTLQVLPPLHPFGMNDLLTNKAQAENHLVFRYGVMTSPTDFHNRLLITGTTLLTATTLFNGAATTTTLSPTYARFHRTHGGFALMPTAAGYSAAVSAVTYSTDLGATDSQLLSATGTGVKGLAARSLVGGAAGFGETIQARIFGAAKIDGSRSNFSEQSISSTTGTSAAASFIEFPAMPQILESAGGGPYYALGSWSYTDILPD